MSDEKKHTIEKVDDADLEAALDELDAGEETFDAKDVVASMAAMIEGVRKAVA